MSWSKDIFGEKIREIREAKGWTLADCTAVSGIARSSLSLAENGYLPIGKKFAKDLADAFKLKDAERREFLLLAAESSKVAVAGGVTKVNRGFPVRVLNALPDYLRGAGFDPKDVIGYILIIKTMPEHGAVDTLFNSQLKKQYEESGVMKPSVKKYILENIDKKQLAVLCMKDGRQVVINAELKVF